jgi:hypothetical protein
MASWACGVLSDDRVLLELFAFGSGRLRQIQRYKDDTKTATSNDKARARQEQGSDEATRRFECTVGQLSHMSLNNSMKAHRYTEIERRITDAICFG